jgi:tripartite-type tricarboxylate transporter receptor subunit TctC
VVRIRQASGGIPRCPHSGGNDSRFPSHWLGAPIGTSEAIIDKISEDLRKVTLDPELQKKLAPLGSYTNPMSAAETTAFVHKQQQTWQPILDEIAKNQR